MLLRFLIFSIMAKNIVLSFESDRIRGLYFTEHCFMLLNKNYLHVGHRQYFFHSVQALLHSWQLLICGYPRDSSNKVCVHLLFLSQDMICCS